jgi:O-antigen ligase
VKVLEYLLIFLIVFSPLFYGSVGQIPLSIIEIISLCSFSLLVFNAKISNRKIIYPAKISLIMIFLLLILFQMAYLPNFLIKIISPHTYILKQQYNPYFNIFGFSQLSFYPLVNIEELIRFISFFFIFICTLNVFEKKEQFERVTLVLIFLGLLLSFYGVITKYFILQKEVSRAFSTFGNRNHFAAYMIMIAPLSIAYALCCRNKNKKIIFSFIAAIICSAVFLSLSRGGSLSLIISLFFMSFLLMKEKLHGNQYWIIAAIIIFALILVSMSGFGPIGQRMSILKEGFAGRWFIMSDSLAMLKDFPLFGIGLGGFKYVFTLYQKSRQVAIYYDYLHNDYMQFLIESGLVCAALLSFFFLRLFKNILIELNKRHDSFAKSIVIGGSCGMLAVSMHSFVDFNFHIPAVSLLFWFILGLVYKCVTTHFYSPGAPEDK